MNLSLFYLLGFINNYAGGFDTENGVFQRISFLDFNHKVSQHKIDVCDKLVKVCEAALSEFDLDNDIVVKNWETNKWEKSRGANIYSKNIVTIINLFCTSKTSFFGRDHFLLDDKLFEEFDWRDENSISQQQRIKFLSGALDSNAVDNQFYFHNEYEKCIMVYGILKCFGDEGDEIEMKSYFATPYTDVITINKKGNLWKFIKQRCR